MDEALEKLVKNISNVDVKPIPSKFMKSTEKFLKTWKGSINMSKQLKDYQIRVVDELHDFFNFILIRN